MGRFTFNYQDSFCPWKFINGCSDCLDFWGDMVIEENSSRRLLSNCSDDPKPCFKWKKEKQGSYHCQETSSVQVVSAGGGR